MDRPVTDRALAETSALVEAGFPETAAAVAAFWVGDLVFAAEYWFLRAASLSLSVLRWFRNSSLAVASAFVLLLAGSALGFNLHNQVSDARRRTAILDVAALSNGVALFRIETGQIPARLEDLVPKYVKALRSDPWGNNYVLYRGPGGVAIVSAGPDGQLGTSDDVVTLGSGGVLISRK